MRITSSPRIATLVVLLLALIPLTWLAWTNRDLPQFGKYQDDGLYLIAAKSLHDGEGFRISSLPGEPAQTKYQPLYALLLSSVWLADFPQNLEQAAALQWMIVVAFLLLSCVLMRSYAFDPWKCALMVAFLAINPWLLYWGLLPIADFFFATLILAVFLLFRKHWATAGLLAAAAALTKVAGILILPALLFTKPRTRRSLLIAVPIVVAFAAWTLWAQSHRSHLDHSVMWYYTDYLGFYLKNNGLAALPDIAPTNLTSLIMLAGNSVLQNLSDSMAGRFLSVILFAAAISGTRRLIRRTGSPEYPVFCGLLLLLLIVWNFSPNVRLAAPVMPLLAMSLWEEGAHLATLISRSITSKKLSDRIAAHGIRTAVLAGIALAAFLNVQFIFTGLPALLQADRVQTAEDRALFDWCRKSLPSTAAVMANNDTLFHLTTGLKAVRPVPNSVAFYTNDTAGQLKIFNEIEDFEDHFGLTHIVLTPTDFADFDEPQRKAISQKLLANPRHKPIFTLGQATVLEIERPLATSASR